MITTTAHGILHKFLVPGSEGMGQERPCVPSATVRLNHRWKLVFQTHPSSPRARTPNTVKNGGLFLPSHWLLNLFTLWQQRQPNELSLLPGVSSLAGNPLGIAWPRSNSPRLCITARALSNAAFLSPPGLPRENVNKL